MLSPYLGTTYSPRGKRPSVSINCSVSDRFYMASAVSSRGSLVFHHRERPYDTDGIIDFLRTLLGQVAGGVLIVWDGASVHRSKRLKQFLAEAPEAKRLHLAIQPAYSPHLNADEQVWQRVKNVALRNTCFQNFKELKKRVVEEMEVLATDVGTLKKFFHHPELGFYQFSM